MNSTKQDWIITAGFITIFLFGALFAPSITGNIVVNLEQERNISIDFIYNSGTPWDSDDDGYEIETSAIDMSISDSSFKWNADETYLCTKYEVVSYDDATITRVCFGGEQCCTFMGVAPSESQWNTTFELTKGRYGAGSNNTVHAQIAYVEYNLSEEAPYSDVRFSNVGSLDAVFTSESSEGPSLVLVDDSYEELQRVLNVGPITRIVASASTLSTSEDAVVDFYNITSSESVIFAKVWNDDTTVTTPVVGLQNATVSSAVIELPKNGEVDTIYKCDDENLDYLLMECSQWDATSLSFEDLGTSIRFTVDSFSAYAGGNAGGNGGGYGGFGFNVFDANISSCTTLNETGTFFLNSSITVEINETCMFVNTSDVILDCQDNFITGNNSGVGVYASTFSNITIQNCAITNFTYGVHLNYTDNATIVGSNISYNTHGIHLNRVNHTNITYSHIGGNSLNGIIDEHSSHGTFTYSAYFSQTTHIRSNHSHDNFIHNNSFRSGDSLSAHFSGSDRNNITNNTYISNFIHIHINSSGDTIGINNEVYYNSFNDSLNVNAHADSAFNYWNTSGGRGNFWDDVIESGLNIIDTNGDGFGDSGSDYPYSLANSADVSGVVVDNGPIVAAQVVIDCGDSLNESKTMNGSDITAAGTCLRISASNVELDCNGSTIFYDSGGTGGDGIIANDVENINITRCTIQDLSAGGSFGWGINFTNVSNALIKDSTIQTNGTTRNYAIAWHHGINNTIRNNTIRTAGTGIANHVVYLLHTVNSTSITDNTISTGGTSLNFGVYLAGHSSFSVVDQNTVDTTTSTGVANAGIVLENNTINSNITSNTVTSSGDGVFGLIDPTGTYIALNSITASGSSTSNGVDWDDSQGLTFFSNTIVTDSGAFGIDLDNINDTFFENTHLESSEWIRVSGGMNVNLSNTSLVTANGRINYFDVLNATTLRQSNVNVSSNLAFVNSSFNNTLNQSATIYFTGIGFSDPKPQVDFGSGAVDCSVPLCTELSYSGGVFVFNVSHFTTYTSAEAANVGGGGGGGGGGRSGGSGLDTPAQGEPDPEPTPEPEPEPAPELPPVTPEEPEQPIQVVVPESPSAIAGGEKVAGIDPLAVAVADIACYTVEGESSVELVNPVSSFQAPLGWEIIQEPFGLSCSGEKISLSLNVPEIYGDVQLLVCRGNECAPSSIDQTDSLVCSGSDSRGADVFDAASYFEELSLTEQQVEQISDQYSAIIVEGSGQTSFGLVSNDVPQPKNQRLAIAGLPITLNVEGDVSTVDVELPLIVSPRIDSESLQIYYYDDGWRPLSSVVDVDASRIRARIDVSKISSRDTILLSTVGLLCDDCKIESMQQVYHPAEGSRAAVLLVHGLGSSPATFQKIIDDITLTKQPWQAWTYAYSDSGTTQDIAEDLANQIEMHSDQYDVLYIVAHSLGGIITEKSLSYAFNQHAIDSSSYTFIEDVRKVIVVGSPHDPVSATTILDQVLDYVINIQATGALFAPNSVLTDELTSGNVVEPVPGISYFVIAGTQPYQFLSGGVTVRSDDVLGIEGANDGLVSTESAQRIGDMRINNQCFNYWEIPATHTEMLQNDDTRVLIQKIVAEELRKELRDIALMGNNKIYQLDIASCSEADTYILIGKRQFLRPFTEDAYGCSCGDNVCGVGEDTFNCPGDCLLLYAKPANIPILGVSALLLILLAIALVTRKQRDVPALKAYGLYAELILHTILISLVASDILLTKKDVIPVLLNSAIIAALLYRMFYRIAHFHHRVDRVRDTLKSLKINPDTVDNKTLQAVIADVDSSFVHEHHIIRNTFSKIKEWMHNQKIFHFAILILALTLTALLIVSMQVVITGAIVGFP